MSTWNMPPGVTTNDIPGQDDDAIETACDDLRMALQDPSANGPDEHETTRVDRCLRHVQALADRLKGGA